MKRTAESGRMQAKAEEAIHMIIFLRQSLLNREGLFWQTNNDGKIIFLWASDTLTSTHKKGDDNFLSLVICTKFACNHSISYYKVSLCLDILNEEHGRVNLGERRNRIKRNGIRDRQKKRARHYSP